MKVKILLGLIGGLLVLTAPWPFVATSPVSILGFPPWACYCLCMTALFAAVVSLLLQFAWGIFARQDEHQDG